MSTAAVKRLTPEEYLAFERAALEKHEFYDGEVFAMAGASQVHNIIAVNTSGAFGNALRDSPCRVYAVDMRLKCPTGLYTYPDVLIVCGQSEVVEDEHRDTLLNPKVIIEILSPSTEAYDRGKKFEHYRRIPTLQAYILISQDRTHVEHFERVEGRAKWVLTETDGTDAILDVPLLGIKVELAEIYRDVPFSKARITPHPDSNTQR
jgi:Uma2 family endonuclease